MTYYHDLRDLALRPLIAHTEPEAPETVKVLFPTLQAGVCVALATSLMLMPHIPQAVWLYTTAVWIWASALTTRLILHFGRRSRLCNRQGSMAVLAAAWHVPLGMVVGAPAVTLLGLWVLAVMAVYGWRCHRNA